MILQIAHLKAARLFASKQDVRFYLNGVLVEGRNIVATDGFAMLVIPQDELTADDSFQAILPNDAIDYFLKKVAAHDKHAVECTLSYDGFNATLKRGDVTESFQRIDARYPDWTRMALPDMDMDDCRMTLFDFAQMPRFVKAATILGASKHTPDLALLPRGHLAAARVNFLQTPHVYGVLMPQNLKGVTDKK